MKIKANRVAMLRALDAVLGWVDSKSPALPMKCVRIEADKGPPTRMSGIFQDPDAVIEVYSKGFVRLTGVCRDGAATITVPAEVTEAGVLLIPQDQDRAREALSKCRNAEDVSIFPGSTIIKDPDWKCPKIPDPEKPGKMIDDPDASAPLIESPHGCTFQLGPNRYKWASPDPDLFSGSLPEADEGRHVDIGVRDFLRAIPAAISATDKKSEMYALGGVLVEREGDKLRLVSTDGRMVCVQDLDAAWGPGLASIPEQMVLDRDGLKRVLGAAETFGKEGGAEIRLWIPEIRRSNAAFQVGDLLASVRLMEKRFPNYRLSDRDLGDPVFDISLKTPALFVQCVQMAAIQVDGNKGGIEIEFDGVKAVEFWSECPDGGFGNIIQPCRYRGPAFATGIRPSFLIAAIEGAPKDPLSPPVVSFYGQMQPVRVTAPGYSYLVMADVSGRAPRNAELKEAWKPLEEAPPKKAKGKAPKAPKPEAAEGEAKEKAKPKPRVEKAKKAAAAPEEF